MKRIPTKNPDLVWRDEPAEKERILAALEKGEEVADEGWVIIVDGGVINQLNLLAGEMWLLCDGVRDEEAIAEELAEGYEAPVEMILEDVAAFVDDCAKRGWLVINSPTSGGREG